MKKNFCFTLVAVFALTSAQTASAKLAGNYVGCVSEESFSELNTAIVKQDERLLKSLTLIEKKCILVDGLEYSVLSQGFIKSKAKFYLEDGTSVVLWVPSEAIK
jgi:hypothetical protein